MVTITTRFTPITWYAADLLLSTAYAWKQYVRILRIPNASGSGFSSNNAGTGPQSYSTIKLGDQFVLDAKNIPSIGFDIDNGTPPSGGTPAPKVREIDGSTIVTGETVYEVSESTQPDTAGTLTAAFTQGTGTVEISFDEQTWATVNNTPVAAEQLYYLRVQHPVDTAFKVTTIFTYA